MGKHVVIIGAVALGPKAAARFKRLEPDSRVTLVERGRFISYGGCGIPFYVAGDVSDIEELQSTAFHMLRDETFFRQVKGVEVRSQTEALGIDRAAKTVRLRHLPTGREETLAYDKLVLATGSSPRRLGVPGEDLAQVCRIVGLEDAEAIRLHVAAGDVTRAVVVGAGFVGLEMAVALSELWGVETTVLELQEQILAGVCGPNLARMVQKHMEDKGVAFRLGARLRELAARDGRVASVLTDTGELPADLVVAAVGVTPQSALAREAGLAISAKGCIVVDESLRTSDPDIFAGGDCVELPHVLTGQPAYLPLGSQANRQGRVIGTNLAGGNETIAPVVGAWCAKLFDLGVAGAGLSLPAAQAAGFDAVAVHVRQVDRAHFHPDKALMSLELVAERGSGRILGVQGLGQNGDAVVGKVNVIAALLPEGLTAKGLGRLELAYSPPFSAALDILNVLGNAAENILEGRNKGIQAEDFARLWAARNGSGPVFLDCREAADAKPLLERFPQYWRNIPQGELRERLAELPRDRGVVLVCNTGARSYEALVTLTHAGFPKLASVEGGMTAVQAAGLDP